MSDRKSASAGAPGVKSGTAESIDSSGPRRTPEHMILELIRISSEHGIDPAPLLAEAGIASLEPGERFTHLSRKQIAEYMSKISALLGDESAGFGGVPIPLGACMMVGRIAVTQTTLKKALVAGFRFYDMITEAFHAQISAENDRAFLEIKLSPAPSERDPHHIFAELMILSWHRFSCFLTGHNIPLIDVYFNYDVPAHADTYAELLPGNHIFNRNKLGFSFPSSYLEKKVIQDDNAAKEFMKGVPLCYVEHYRDDSLSAKILRQLRPRVRTGLPGLDEVATHLDTTKRTLNRKLKTEFTSYQKLKDIARRDEAISLLTENKLPIHKISKLIQFSEPAVFSRAFLAWTGESPSQFRDKIVKKY